MKKLILIAGTFLFIAPGFAQKKSVISGKVTSPHKIETVYLRYTSEEGIKMDSTLIQNGAFSFNPELKGAGLAQLRVKYSPKDAESRPGYEVKMLFLEPGKTDITITDSLVNASVKGGTGQKDFEALTLLEKPYNDKSRALQQEYMKFRKDNDQDGMDRVENEFDELDKAKKDDVYLKFLKTKQNSPVALYVLENYAGYDINPDEIAPLFNQLSKSIKESASGKSYNERIEAARKTAVGAMAMDFTQNDTLDKPVSLKDFRGKYVLVDFWASWCGPCRAENPNVVKAFNKYKDKNFTVLGISLDQPDAKQAWLDAIHKDELTWTHVSDLKFWDNAVAKQYGIRAIPQNFLIDPSGKIIAKNIRGEELQNKLSEILD